MSRKLVIEFDEDEDEECAMVEVQRLISEGYTSGYEPQWYFEDDND